MISNSEQEKESGAVAIYDGEDDDEEGGRRRREIMVSPNHMHNFLPKQIPWAWERTASSECIQEGQTSHQSRIVIRSSASLTLHW